MNSPEAQLKAIDLVEKAVQKDPENADMQELLKFASKEIKEDNHMLMPAEKVRSDTLIAWMK